VTESSELPWSTRIWQARKTWPFSGEKWKTPLEGTGSRALTMWRLLMK
jgi:hypothetical protein